MAGVGESPHQLALHDQPQVGPGLLVEEDEGEEVWPGLDLLELDLPGHVVQYQRVAADIPPRDQKTVEKFLPDFL